MKKAEHGGFLGSKTILYDTIVADTCCYTSTLTNCTKLKVDSDAL